MELQVTIAVKQPSKKVGRIKAKAKAPVEVIEMSLDTFEAKQEKKLAGRRKKKGILIPTWINLNIFFSLNLLSEHMFRL